MNTAAQSSLWQQIDGVIVINLDQRTDRWTQFQQNVSGLIPPEKLHRLSACWGRNIPGFGQRPWFRGGTRDGNWAARAGCTESHRQAMLQARAAGWRTTLILEDDVVFTPAFATLLPLLAEKLPQQDWQICYLGFTDAWAPTRRLADLDAQRALFEVQGCTTTHAYLVREAARNWIMTHLPAETEMWPWLARHRVVDRWYQRQLGLHFPVLCVSPSLVNQVEGFSDIAEGTARATEPRSMVSNTTASPAAYYLGRAWRRISVRFGLANDVLRGWIKRLTGF